MKKVLLLLSLFTIGCSHSPYGAHQIVKGSEVLKKGTERTYTEYKQSYRFVENYCKSEKDKEECMKYWELHPEEFAEMMELYAEIMVRQQVVEEWSKELPEKVERMEEIWLKSKNAEENLKRFGK